MEFRIKISTIICLFLVYQSYGMDDERKEAKQEKKSKNQSTSLPSNTNHAVKNAWFRYIQHKKSHPTSTKGLAKSKSIQIFEVALEALTSIGFNPNAINIMIKENIDGTLVSKSKKTIFIPKYFSRKKHLIERLLWDLTYATQSLNPNNSSDQKRNKFETIASTIRLLLEKKIFTAIGDHALFLIKCVLNDVKSSGPVPFQEQYNYIVHLLKKTDVHLCGKITKITDNQAQISLFADPRYEDSGLAFIASAIVSLRPADYERVTARFQIEEMPHYDVTESFSSRPSASNLSLSSPTQNAIQVLANLISQLHNSATQTVPEESNRNTPTLVASMGAQSSGTVSAQTSNQTTTAMTTISSSASATTTAATAASSSLSWTSACVIL